MANYNNVNIMIDNFLNTYYVFKVFQVHSLFSYHSKPIKLASLLSPYYR